MPEEKKTENIPKSAETVASEENTAAPAAEENLGEVHEIGANGYIKRRRRWGDRKDGRKLHKIYPMLKFMPYVMPKRCDALNTFADSLDMTKTDKFCRQKIKEGKTNFSLLHVMIAAYVRAISQKPGINRFVSGQKIYARNEIAINMVIKREMSPESPDTCIKVFFLPTDTVDDVYEKFNALVEANKKIDDRNSFDKLNKALVFIPGLFLKFTVGLLSFLDYFGWLPKKLTDLSPFHGSMFITSMGSLGIPPIYHHIYNFGNIAVFMAYGTKRNELYLDRDGNVQKRKVVDLKVVTDERICDGYYYASAFKMIKRMVENPELLELPPEQVVEDVD